MLRIKDWIKSCFWIPIIGALLVNSPLINIFLIAIISFFVLAFAYSINNYFDVEIDREHKKKTELNINPLAQGLITKEGSLIILGFTVFVSLALSFSINFLGFIFILLIIIFGIFYSTSFIRLKEKRFLDLINHGLGIGFFPFLAGVKLGEGNIDLPLILIAFLFCFLNIIFLLIHQINDYEEDFGKTNNTTLIVGIRNSYLLICFFIILALFFSRSILIYYSIDNIIYYFLIAIYLVIFPFIWYIRDKFIVMIKNSFKLSPALLNSFYESGKEVYKKRIRIFFR